jgi:Pyridoxamine 5'-phosphate oxidase
VLEHLSEAECTELLVDGGVGRLVYTSRYGLTALPVAYKIDEGSVVLGTRDPALFDEDLRTGIAQADYQVVVEVHQIDVKARGMGSCWYGGGASPGYRVRARAVYGCRA